LIGQSLGAHVSGNAGLNYWENTTTRIERITGEASNVSNE
jgi:hypothetical protein